MSTTYTTASTERAKTMNIADLERMVQVLQSLPPEPIGEWMRACGKPPEQWRLVLPLAMRDQVDAPALWPSYVMFSTVLDKPVFLRNEPFAQIHKSLNTHAKGGAA